MSSPLAIAGVTAVLADLLNNGVVDHNLAAALGNVKVSARPPDRVTPGNGADANQLNLFLYHVAPNPGWRNVGLPSRDDSGVRLTNPPLALDLYYLLTSYGEKDFNAEILLGYAMHLLHETPMLTRDAIRNALRSPSAPVTGGILPAEFKALAAVDLAEQVEQIKIAPQSMNTEEMSKLWMALQTSYRPTAAYHVAVVLIEAKRPTKRVRPVLEPIIKVMPLRRPVIDSVEEAGGPNEPIVANSTLLVRGQQLRAENTSVVIGGASATLTPQNFGDSQIKITLPIPGPPILRAGVQDIQIVQQIDLGKPPVPHQGIESNVLAFVLHPKITVPANASGNIQITFDPKVEKDQRVTLFLDERNAPAGQPARCFSIAAPLDNGITSAAQTETAKISFTLKGVDVGQYFVRAQVDGAESLLTTNAQGQFNGPAVTIA